MKKLEGDVLLGFSDMFGAGPIMTPGSKPAPTKGLALPVKKLTAPVAPAKRTAFLPGGTASAPGGVPLPPDPIRDVPGATPGAQPPAPPRRMTSEEQQKRSAPPVKIKPYPKVPQNKTAAEHGKIMAKGRETLTKAVSALTGKPMQRLTAKPTASVPGAVKRQAFGRVAMGTLEQLTMAGAKPVKKLPANAVKLLKKRAEVIKQLADIKTKLKAKGQSLKPKIQKLAAALVNQKKVSLAMRTPGKSVVGSLMGSSLLGEVELWIDQNGYIVDANGNYYDANGNPSSTPVSADSAATTPSDPSLDAGVTDLPAVDLSALSEADIVDALDSGTLPPAEQFPPSTVFDDYKKYFGILYKGEKGRPNGYVLSYGLATRETDQSAEPDTVMIEGNEHYGYVWGKYDKKDPPNGGVGWGSNLREGTWNHIFGRHYFDNDAEGNYGSPSNHRGWWQSVSAEEAYKSSERKSDRGKPYGPLVGNPVGEFRGMRVDLQGNMFWLPQEAPEWLLAPIRQAMAVTKAMEEKARKEAEEAHKLAVDAANKQNELDKINADAQRAMSEADAISQANIQTAQAEADAATSLVDQQNVDLQQQMLDQQQQQLDLQEQQMEQQYMQQMQQYMQQMQQAGYPPPGLGPEGEDYYYDPNEDPMAAAADFDPYADYGQQPLVDELDASAEMFDDGTMIPGGDIMRDEDGEGFEDEGV